MVRQGNQVGAIAASDFEHAAGGNWRGLHAEEPGDRGQPVRMGLPPREGAISDLIVGIIRHGPPVWRIQPPKNNFAVAAMAHALLRAASSLHSTPERTRTAGVGMSADAARRSACAISASQQGTNSSSLSR